MKENKMHDATPELVIRSEDDAWAALEKAVDGKGFPANLNIRFDGWPSFELKVKGRDWNQTVPTRIMPALIEVQRDIHRAYASIEYGEANLRRLREEDRDALEVVVKVDKGSSAYDADLWEQLTRLAVAATSRMSGTQAVIAVIGVALTIGATSMFKAWMKRRQQEKALEISVDLSRQETERLKIMADAMKQQPIVREANEDAAATNNRLLKATRPGDTMNVAGVPVVAEVARELVQPERERAKGTEFDGVFSILGNRTDKSDGFRITLRRESDNMTFQADVPLALNHDQQQIIQNAEWSKTKLKLGIDADMLRGSIVRATVTHAEALPKTHRRRRRR